MTTARQILFSAPMVRALLEGRKTQTRRLMKRQPVEHHWRTFKSYRVDARLLRTTKGMGVRYLHSFAEFGADNSELEDFVTIPYGVPGDLLWVRESWHLVHVGGGRGGGIEPFNSYDQMYMADGHREHFTFEGEGDPFLRFASDRPRPSMFMPRWASRLTLEITDIRVERLQDISKPDVIAEGITERDGCQIDDVVSGWHEPYAQLWDKLNGPGAWDNNPWVVALTFTVHKQNVDAFMSARSSTLEPAA